MIIKFKISLFGKLVKLEADVPDEYIAEICDFDPTKDTVVDEHSVDYIENMLNEEVRDSELEGDIEIPGYTVEKKVRRHFDNGIPIVERDGPLEIPEDKWKPKYNLRRV